MRYLRTARATLHDRNDFASCFQPYAFSRFILAHRRQSSRYEAKRILGKKRGQVPFYCCFGLPGFRIVASSPSFLAVSLTHAVLP